MVSRSDRASEDTVSDTVTYLKLKSYSGAAFVAYEIVLETIQSHWQNKTATNLLLRSCCLLNAKCTPAERMCPDVDLQHE